MADYRTSLKNFSSTPNQFSLKTLADRFERLKKAGNQFQHQRCFDEFHERGSFRALLTFTKVLCKSKESVASLLPAFKACGTIVASIMHNTTPKSTLRQELVSSGVLELLMQSCVSLKDEAASDVLLSSAIKLVWDAAQLHLNTTAPGIMAAHIDAFGSDAFCATFQHFFATDWPIAGCAQAPAASIRDHLTTFQIFKAVGLARKGGETLAKIGAHDILVGIIEKISADEGGVQGSAELRAGLVNSCLRLLETHRALLPLSVVQEDVVVQAAWRIPAAQRDVALLTSLFGHRVNGAIAEIEACAHTEAAGIVPSTACLLSVLASDATVANRIQRNAIVMQVLDTSSQNSNTSIEGRALSAQLRACLVQHNSDALVDAAFVSALLNDFEHVASLVNSTDDHTRKIVHHCKMSMVESFAHLSNSLSAELRALLASGIGKCLERGQEFVTDRTIWDLLHLFESVDRRSDIDNMDVNGSVLQVAKFSLGPLVELRVRHQLAELISCISSQHRAAVVGHPNAVEYLVALRPHELFELCSPATFSRATEAMDVLRSVHDLTQKGEAPGVVAGGGKSDSLRRSHLVEMYSTAQTSRMLSDAFFEDILHGTIDAGGEEVSPASHRHAIASVVAGKFYSTHVVALQDAAFLSEDTYSLIFDAVDDLAALDGLIASYVTAPKVQSAVDDLAIMYRSHFFVSQTQPKPSWTAGQAEAARQSLSTIASFGRLNAKLLVDAGFPELTFEAMSATGGFPGAARFRAKCKGMPKLLPILNLHFQILRCITTHVVPSPPLKRRHSGVANPWLDGAFEQILESAKGTKLNWFKEPCAFLANVVGKCAASDDQLGFKALLRYRAPSSTNRKEGTFLAAFATVFQELFVCARDRNFKPGDLSVLWFDQLQTATAGALHTLQIGNPLPSSDSADSFAPEHLISLHTTMTQLVSGFEPGTLSSKMLLELVQLVARTQSLLDLRVVLGDITLLDGAEAWDFCKNVLEQLRNSPQYEMASAAATQILAVPGASAEHISSLVSLLHGNISEIAPVYDAVWELYTRSRSGGPFFDQVDSFMECLDCIGRREEFVNTEPLLAATTDFLFTLLHDYLQNAPETVRGEELAAMRLRIATAATNTLLQRRSASAALILLAILRANIDCPDDSCTIDAEALRLLATKFAGFARVVTLEDLESSYAHPVVESSVDDLLAAIASIESVILSQRQDDALCAANNVGGEPDLRAEAEPDPDQQPLDMNMHDMQAGIRALQELIPSMAEVLDPNGHFVLDDPDVLRLELGKAQKFLQEVHDDLEIELLHESLLPTLCAVFEKSEAGIRGLPNPGRDRCIEAVIDTSVHAFPFLDNALELRLGQLILHLQLLQTVSPRQRFERLRLDMALRLFNFDVDAKVLLEHCQQVQHSSLLLKFVEYVNIALSCCSDVFGDLTSRGDARLISLAHLDITLSITRQMLVDSSCNEHSISFFTLCTEAILCNPSLAEPLFRNIRATACAIIGKPVKLMAAVEPALDMVDTLVALCVKKPTLLAAEQPGAAFLEDIFPLLLDAARDLRAPETTLRVLVSISACLRANVVCVKHAAGLQTRAKAIRQSLLGDDSVSIPSRTAPNVISASDCSTLLSLVASTCATHCQSDHQDSSGTLLGDRVCKLAAEIIEQISSLAMQVLAHDRRHTDSILRAALMKEPTSSFTSILAIVEAVACHTARSSQMWADSVVIVNITNSVRSFVNLFEATNQLTTSLQKGPLSCEQQNAVIEVVNRCWVKLIGPIASGYVLGLQKSPGTELSQQPSFAFVALQNILAVGAALSRSSVWADIVLAVGEGGLLLASHRHNYQKLVEQLLRLTEHPLRRNATASEDSVAILYTCLEILLNLLGHQTSYQIFSVRYIAGIVPESQPQRRGPRPAPKSAVLSMLADVLRCTGRNRIGGRFFACAQLALNILECCVSNATTLLSRPVADEEYVSTTSQAIARALERFDVEGALHGARALYRGRSEKFVLQINLILHCIGDWRREFHIYLSDCGGGPAPHY